MKLFKLLTTCENSTISFIYDYNPNNIVFYKIIEQEIKNNGFTINFLDLNELNRKGYYEEIRKIKNSKNTINIISQRYYEPIGNTSLQNKQMIYISSYVILLKDNTIKIIKSRTNIKSTFIYSIDKYIRKIKLYKLNNV